MLYRLFESRRGVSLRGMSTTPGAGAVATATLTTATLTSMSTATNSSHHAPGGGFCNPPEWGSHRDVGPIDFFTRALPHWDISTVYIPQPIETPDFAALSRARFAAMWLGHCTFVLALGRTRVLTDPFFSQRASPVSFAGPSRFTPAPSRVSELPLIDVVAISHSHYDHLDKESVRALLRAPCPPRLWVVPLGVDALLRDFGVPQTAIRALDWWQSTTTLDGTGDGDGDGDADAVAASEKVVFTLVPAQHGSARTMFDRNATLWGGFYMQSSEKTVYFAGDTGYRAVEHSVAPGSAAEAAAPHCPAFREMRARLGAPDLALLPIGAYSPRGFMSTVHASPEDALDIFDDVGAAAAIGCHFGSLPLTDERVDEPPERLARAIERHGGESAKNFVCLRNGGLWVRD